jgi:predicted RNA-binding protein YlxR (DUF448 family)
VLAKRSLIRIVRSPQGVMVDPTGKMPGRGAYLHDLRSCWDKGLKGAVAHALKTELTGEERETLAAFAKTLPQADARPQVDGGGSLPDGQNQPLIEEGPDSEGQKMGKMST